ncbi:hypothetical protein ABPG75_001194 [Micractinium tetrahymenae]
MQTAAVAARGYVAAPATQSARAGRVRAVAAASTACRSAAIPENRAQPRAAACRHRRSAIAEAAATALAPQATVLPQLPPLDDGYESACAFTDFANWLIPGRVMLGRYPFVEPSRCRSRDVGEEQLRQLLAAGITTFVSLQAEIPEQSAMRIGGVDGFVPYRPSATLLATALSPPPSIEEIAALRTPELDRYLPPRRRPSAWQQRQRIELDFVHCPIVDLGLPDADRLRLLLADMAQRLDDGENLYVHCWGGRGRAGTVGACLLAQLYGMPADEALERIQRSFDTRKDGGRRSPETDEQHEFVRRFIAEMVRA